MSAIQRMTDLADELDEILHGLLRDSVRGKTPSSDVRDALLHAAADDRQRTLEVYQATQTDSHAAEMWNDQRQESINSNETLGMLQAYFQRLRFVV